MCGHMQGLATWDGDMGASGCSPFLPAARALLKVLLLRCRMHVAQSQV